MSLSQHLRFQCTVLGRQDGDTAVEQSIRRTLRRVNPSGVEFRRHYAEIALDRCSSAEIAAGKRSFDLPSHASRYELALRVLERIDETG